MPALQTLLTRLNRFGDAEVLSELDPALFEPGKRLSDAARELGYEDEGLLRYLDQLPVGVHEALRALIQSALTRPARQPITFAWAPGYDYELTIWDVSATPETPGGITVLLRSRYPADTHPLATGS